MDPEPVGIVHGDYRIGNVILHPTEPKVIGVLDWFVPSHAPTALSARPVRS